VPFLVWNTIYYLGYVIGSRLPGVSDIMGKGEIPFGWYAAVDAVLHYTYNYVFWYLFQLLLLILLAPVLYPVLHNVWSRGLLFLALWIVVARDLRLSSVAEQVLWMLPGFFLCITSMIMKARLTGRFPLLAPLLPVGVLLGILACFLHELLHALPQPGGITIAVWGLSAGSS